MTDLQPTPPELNEGGKWGLIILMIFLFGLPAAGIIISILFHKP